MGEDSRVVLSLSGEAEGLKLCFVFDSGRLCAGSLWSRLFILP